MLCVDSSRLCMSGLSLCDLCLCYSILGSQFSNKYLVKTKCLVMPYMAVKITRNSSGDEIANVNFLYDDIVHALKIQ